MKQILLACTLMAFCGISAIAQNAKQTATASSVSPKADPKSMFAAKVNELEGNLTHNQAANASANYGELAAMMQTLINENMKLMAGANEEKKQKLSALVEKQNILYSKAKVLSVDLAKNQTDVITSLKTFLQTF